MTSFLTRLSQLGFKSYAEYLASGHWRDFKARYRAKRSMRCAVCQTSRVQLHHHTYRNLGDESLGDVTPLCDKHHDEIHRLLNYHGWAVEKTGQLIRQLQGKPKKVKVAQPQTKRPKGKKNHGPRNESRARHSAWKSSARVATVPEANWSDTETSMRAIAAGIRPPLR